MADEDLYNTYECTCTSPNHGGKLWLCDTEECKENQVTSEIINTIDLNRRPALKEQIELEGKCHALWLLNGNETGKWNGEGCNCEYIQGNLNCKLNPF